MKIDAVLARYPWPWRVVYGTDDEWWEVRDAKNKGVFDDGSTAGIEFDVCSEATRDAILELVEAHVAAAGRKAKSEASEDKP